MGFWNLSLGIWVLDFEVLGSEIGFRNAELVLRVKGLGFRVWR